MLPERLREVISKLQEELLDARQLLQPRLGMNRQKLIKLRVGQLQPAQVQIVSVRKQPDRRFDRAYLSPAPTANWRAATTW